MSKFLILIFLIIGCKANPQSSEEEQFYSSLNDSIKSNPQNLEWRYIRAMGSQEKTNHLQAITDLTVIFNYLKKNGTSFIVGEDTINLPTILWDRAYSYRMTDSTEKSVADYRELLKYRPTDFFCQTAIPYVYIKHKKYAEAQKEISETLSKNPDNERALVYQSVLEYEMGEFEKSLLSINKALQKFPNSIEGLVTKSKILNKVGKNSEACLTLEDARKKNNIDYFGGERGYMRSFQEEIDSLQTTNCK